MLHPVGDLAPSVYWRRRVLLLAALLLALVTVYALFLRGGGGDAPRRNGNFTAAGRTSSPPASTPAGSPSASSPAAGSSASSVAPSSPAVGPRACTTGQLSVAAAVDARAYPAGAKPTVAIVVTNSGSAPCTEDLSDRQIELRVYNGSARVWGSHDCAIQPGSSVVTLPVGQATRREVQWSGLSSRPACAGTRTRVAAGTYTVRAFLAGRQSSATASFTLAG